MMNEKLTEGNNIQRSSSSVNDRARINSSSLISDSSFRSVNEENGDILSKIDEIGLNQMNLEEKINDLQNETMTHDLIDAYHKQIEQFQPLLTYINGLNEFQKEFSGENWRFFRRFIWPYCSETNHWKSFAHSIYHIEHLINHLDNYQIKEFLQKPLKILLNNFVLLIKDLITIQIKSQNQEKKKTEELSDSNDMLISSVLPTTSSNIDLRNQIDGHIHNLKNHTDTFRDLILITSDRFTLCETDMTAIQTLLRAVDQINFDSKEFDPQDQTNIRLLALKRNLAEKSNKTDLMQFKYYIDSQIKQLLDLNKRNARELERMKLRKSATCEARHIQTILSSNLSARRPKSNRIHSHQSSQPYITFELNHIRQYQRQALLKSPSGTIPLYRRQAWAAANLLPGYSLPFLRYTQNSLRMQIHHLLGYDPSDLCRRNGKKKKKTETSTVIERFNTSQDISIVGNNNKLYRGRVDACEVIQLKDDKKRTSNVKTNRDNSSDNIQINFDQLNQTNKTAVDEQLFEYLDWQRNLDEQDLPDELYEELFHHWKAVLCEDQPCTCPSESKLTPGIDNNEEDQSLMSQALITSSSSSTSTNDIYEDRCICSECSCACEKYTRDESICLCSQCSCECLKALSQGTSVDPEEISQQNDSAFSPKNLEDSLTNQININEELQFIPSNHQSIVKQIGENEPMISDCFLNRIDRWTEQFDPFQGTFNQLISSPAEKNQSTMQFTPPPNSAPIIAVFNKNCKAFELDDPTTFRQRILDCYRQREQTH